MMDTHRRLGIYQRQGRVTPRMRRRLVKKAGADPHATVVRDDGMGYSPAKQGLRELVGCRPAEPGENCGD